MDSVVAAIVIIYLVITWHDISIMQRLVTLSFMAMVLHQFEEYTFPGGFPAIANTVLHTTEQPDRYPLNQRSAAWINIYGTYCFYLLPVFFPDVIWLGLAPMIMGIGQTGVHVFKTNIEMKSFYNPGMLAVVFLHVPIGIYYIAYITKNNLDTGLDWIITVIYLLLVCVVGLVFLTYKVWPDHNTKYPFSPEEMAKFEKLKSWAVVKKYRN